MIWLRASDYRVESRNYLKNFVYVFKFQDEKCILGWQADSVIFDILTF